MTDPNGWRLTTAQRQLLFLIGEVLDKQAGDGMGTTIEDGSTVWMDELCIRISDTFGLDADPPLDLALRAALPAPPAQEEGE